MKPLISTDCIVDFTEIATASSWDQLKLRRIEYQIRLQQLRLELPISVWMSQVNRMHDLITTKAIEICEQEMVEAGYGPPPVSYSFIVFGSAGRMESTMWSDQDNGLIISDDPNDYKDEYFEKFSTRLCDSLAYLGYDKCLGKVMCSEKLWRKSLREWKETLSDWRSDMRWEPIRYLIIASDARHIVGDHRLAEEFKDTLYQSFTEVPELQYAVLRNTVSHKATLNLLGQVVTERFGQHAGGFDIKYGVYIPLVNFVRFMSLQLGVRETMTQRRLDKLISLDSGNTLLENCQRSFETAIQLRVSTPYIIVDGLFTSSNYISEQELKIKPLLHELRECLGVVRRTHRALQRLLRFAERRNT
jgi:CBS domain-containing protein